MRRIVALLTAGLFLWSVLPARAQVMDEGEEEDWWDNPDPPDPPVYAEPAGDFTVVTTLKDALLLDSNHGYSLMMSLDGVAFYGPDFVERWRLAFPDEYGVVRKVGSYEDPLAATFGTISNGTLSVKDGSVFVSFKDGHLRRFSTEDGHLLTDYDSYNPLEMVCYHEPTETLVVLPIQENFGWMGETIFIGEETSTDESGKTLNSEYYGAGFVPGERKGILWVYTSLGYVIQELDFIEQRVVEWGAYDEVIFGEGFLLALEKDELVRITPESGLSGEAHINVEDAEIFELTEDNLYLAGTEKLVCLDPETLEQRWETKTYRGGGWTGDSFRGFTKLLVLGNELLLVGDDTGLVCFNLDGSDRWARNYGQPVFSTAEQFIAARTGILGYSFVASVLVQLLFGILAKIIYLMSSISVVTIAGHSDPQDGLLGVADGKAFFWDCETAGMIVGGLDETALKMSKLIIVDLETGDARCLIGRPPAFKETGLDEWGDPVVYDWIDGVLIASSQDLLSAYDPSTLEQLWYYRRPPEADRFSMRQLYCEETVPGYGMTTVDTYPIEVRLFPDTVLYDLTYEDRLIFDPHTGPVGVFRTAADGMVYWDDEYKHLFTPGWPLVVYDLAELFVEAEVEEAINGGGED